VKEENERVAALELQIQQKKKQKEDEEAKQKELDRKEDERIAREQEALNSQLREELRRDKALDTASAQQQHNNAFDEQPVGGGSNTKPPSNLFRAPSPILDVNDRNKNLFRAPSPIENHTTPTSPALPAQQNKRVFQAPSPVLESQATTSKRSNQDLFASSPPPSPSYHNPSHRGNSHANSRQSSRHSDQPVEENHDPSSRRTSSHNSSPPATSHSRNKHHHQTPPVRSPQRVDLDANHPIILDLKKETANAKDEAAQARKELEQLRQLVSQDRKRNNAINQPSSPSRKSPHAPVVPKLSVQKHNNNFNMQEAAEIDDLPRTDSARTFVRKYQQSYNADRPPANSLKASRAMQDTTKYRNNNGFDQLEKSLQSESVLHKPKELDGNELPSDFHALLELDKTLKSDSRFVYPDGRAFIPGGGKSSRPSSSKPRPNLTYQLQPYENASAIPVTIPLPQPPQSPSTLPRKYELKIDETLDFINAQSASTLSPSRSISTFGPDSPAGSAMTLASERSRRKQNDFSGSDRNDDDNDNDNDGLDFDIDRAFRRNRRKWELLEKMGLRTEESMDFEAKEKSNVYSGPEELDLLLNGLQSVHSSRPSTANSRPQNSRPGTAGTLQGDSQLIGQGDYGYLLQQERDKYRQNKQQQGTRRRQPSHNLKVSLLQPISTLHLLIMAVFADPFSHH